MKEQIIAEFKAACNDYLNTQSIERLRAYGRAIGVTRPTTKAKGDLIDLIIGVLVGDIAAIPIAKRGAPVKNKYVDPKISEEIERIYERVTQNYILAAAKQNDVKGYQEVKTTEKFDVVAAIAAFRQEKNVLRVADPNYLEEVGIQRKMYKGQLQVEDGMFSLLPIDCSDAQAVIVPVEIVRAYSLREGDLISCYAERSRNMIICDKLLDVNGAEPHEMKIGFKFEEELACYPNERIHMVKGDGADSVTAKYFEWVFPLARGQRGCIFSAPKAGKSRILLDIVTALKGNDQNLEVLALLVDQPPEGVYAFRNQISSENLLYTTYDDEAERQVFVADFMLKRAKRMAELGKDVVLLIDSLSALARVYNETEYSLGGRTLSGDLESKTVHYIKKYLGSARCFQTGGSLTIIAAVACDTGSPFDTILASELVNISNLDVWLNEKAAVKRIYPAMDMQKSSVKYSETLMTDVDEGKRRAVWGKISELDAESLREILAQSSTFDELSSKL